MAAEKSYVTIENQICVVCGQKFDTGAILMDKRLREKFERETLTGWGMCDPHAQLREQGYVALVGADESKSTVVDDHITPENAYRTGIVVHVQQDVFRKVFNVPIPEGGVCFVEPEVCELIRANMPHTEVRHGESHAGD